MTFDGFFVPTPVNAFYWGLGVGGTTQSITANRTSHPHHKFPPIFLERTQTTSRPTLHYAKCSPAIAPLSAAFIAFSFAVPTPATPPS